MSLGLASAATITRLYLYGEEETPSLLTIRLRDLDPGARISIGVSASSYMEGYGLYAVPARAAFVQEFFHNYVTLSPGIYTVAQLSVQYGDAAFRFSFQHAQVDPGNSNYMERSYVFGHASFHLSNDTRFVVAPNGSRSIENLRIIPDDDNFDFVSTGRAQYLNDYYLQPNIDPSLIGRVVDINFTGDVNAQVYTPQAFFADVGRIASWDIDTLAASGIIGSNISAFVEGLRDEGVFETERDGRTIVYDGQRQNVIGAPGNEGAILIGGSGADTLHGNSGNDIFYGGAEGDTFKASRGSDEFWGGDEEGQPELSGTDVVDYSTLPFPVKITFTEGGANTTLKVAHLDGIDTLHSIEKIIGSTRHDTFAFSGTIAAGTSLTIDANGGGETINELVNAHGATSGIKFQNSASGGTVTNATPGSGVITLLNVHTDIIGSPYDDEIVDDASGPKSIDGGAGDDKISVSIGAANIRGGDGDDELNGGDANDVLVGGSGANLLMGNGGSDRLIVSSDGDVADGGEGSDRLVVTAGAWSGADIVLRVAVMADMFIVHLLNKPTHVAAAPLKN